MRFAVIIPTWHVRKLWPGEVKSLVHSLNPPNRVMNLGSLPYVFLSLILLFCSCFTNKLLLNFILRRKVIAPKFINRFYGESFMHYPQKWFLKCICFRVCFFYRKFHLMRWAIASSYNTTHLSFASSCSWNKIMWCKDTDFTATSLSNHARSWRILATERKLSLCSRQHF